MTSQVASAPIGFAAGASVRRPRGATGLWAIRGMGAVRALYGAVAFGSLALASTVGTGVAAVAFAAVGLVTVLLGVATVALAEPLRRNDSAVLAAVIADAAVVLLGTALLLGAWDRFTVSAAAVQLGAVAIAGVSAVVVAVATVPGLADRH